MHQRQKACLADAPTLLEECQETRIIVSWNLRHLPGVALFSLEGTVELVLLQILGVRISLSWEFLLGTGTWSVVLERLETQIAAVVLSMR